MTIAWDCGRRGCYIKTTLPDWSMLDGCFGSTAVKGSDIDGYVHQNGRVLFLEKKFRGLDGVEGSIDQPQVRAINSLVRQGNSFIVFWCSKVDGSDISLMRVFGIEGYNPDIRVDATLDDFRAAVVKWWSAVYQAGKV